MDKNLKEFNLSKEQSRTYSIPVLDNGKITDIREYKIDNPIKLFTREGGTTHRVQDETGQVHCVPAPSPKSGVTFTWIPKDKLLPVQF